MPVSAFLLKQHDLQSLNMPRVALAIQKKKMTSDPQEQLPPTNSEEGMVPQPEPTHYSISLHSSLTSWFHAPLVFPSQTISSKECGWTYHLNIQERPPQSSRERSQKADAIPQRCLTKSRPLVRQHPWLSLHGGPCLTILKQDVPSPTQPAALLHLILQPNLTLAPIKEQGLSHKP